MNQQRGLLLGCTVLLLSCEGLSTRMDLVGAGPVATTGLTARYFRDEALADERARQVDPAIDFSWPGSEAFSARWTGELLPRASEVHRLLLTFTGRARLWVDG